jgi:hypothetical protein
MRSNTGLKCNLAESAGKQPHPRLSAAALLVTLIRGASQSKNKRHVTLSGVETRHGFYFLPNNNS